MGKGSATVYVKADRNVEVSFPKVTLGDVLQIECTEAPMLARIKKIPLLQFPKSQDQRQNRAAVSILKVVAGIHSVFPEAEIQNMGEPDFIVTYEKQKDTGGILHVVKVGAVTMISFAGAAFSIMAFNNDVDVTRLFGQIHEFATGEETSGFTVLEITYSAGLTAGILIFFNHFGKKRFTVDPTPMEIQMRLYENDIQTTLVENASRRGDEIDVGSSDSAGTDRT